MLQYRPRRSPSKKIPLFGDLESLKTTLHDLGKAYGAFEFQEQGREKRLERLGLPVTASDGSRGCPGRWFRRPPYF